ETSRKHTDDCESISVEQELAADDVWIAGKAATPQTLADDGDRMRAGGLVVFSRDHTPHLCAHAEDVEEVSGNDRAVDEIGLIVTVETGGDAAPGDHSIEDIVLIAHGDVIRIG